MAGRRLLALIAVCVGAVAAAAPGPAAQTSLYTRAATQACLFGLPHTVAGLPPATPPVPPALFVYALAGWDVSTWAGNPPAHRQLGAWYGRARYQGIILSFFKSTSDARASLKPLSSRYGGTRIRNVVATWVQESMPSRTVRHTVLACLRSEDRGVGSTPPSPAAALATFAGRWGGHTRGLSIGSSGRGSEAANDGCCVRSYRLTFRILSVRGTLTRATAVFRVTSFRRYERGVPILHVGDVGVLELRNGIVTNRLTRDFFCSDPAWGATNACGA